MKRNITESNLEALLFFVGDLIRIKKLCELLEVTEKEIYLAMNKLNKMYKKYESGLRIIELENSFQMCTAPENMDIILKYKKKSKKNFLTKTLLETLAIIAYKQPITRAQIENIRGVNSDSSVAKLMEYNLVEEAGRLPIIGRPILFATTTEFLRHFNFKTLEELPQIQEELINQFEKEVETEVEYN
ncbi:SMC-Scp complex subunit ScpB [Candidatus Epulonipiscioides gigas]|nr:SMC-Scp complex subunit ScpB [Epulopiscium sp. SCG-C07WGA-EpuloA2]